MIMFAQNNKWMVRVMLISKSRAVNGLFALLYINKHYKAVTIKNGTMLVQKLANRPVQ